MAAGEFQMQLEVARGMPTAETSSFLRLEGIVDSGLAYLGSAGIVLGDGYGCHSTGFRATNPGGSNPLAGFKVSVIGTGTFESREVEIVPVWGTAFIDVDTSIWCDSVYTGTDIYSDTGGVYQDYSFNTDLNGSGYQFGH